MKQFGLIGFPLTHSFSKKYFTEKFESLGISESHEYELFEMEDASAFKKLWIEHPKLQGINITIPHKKNVFDFLDDLDVSARKVGAVNVVKKTNDGKLIGYNSDYYGFKKSILEFLGETVDVKNLKSLILGYGGAARAVVEALKDLGVKIQLVSRTASNEAINYRQSDALIESHQLIINCSPLGTSPKTNEAANIAYQNLTSQHFLFDLVYNPPETLFMKKGLNQGAKVKNGYDMLVYQAEKSWEIWNK